jgi:hypothetical protein
VSSTTWVVIVYIARELWLPLPLSFPTEKDCYDYIETMELEPGHKATCLPGVIEEERRERRRK